MPTVPPRRALCLVGDLCNLGDAFLAETQALHLARDGVRVGVAPYQPPPAGMAAHFARRGLPVLALRTRPLAFLRECLRSDLYIGGGHAVREGVATGWLLLALAGAWLARLRGRRVALVGAGVTPVRDAARRRLWRAVLRACATLNVRDAASAEALVALVPRLRSRVRVRNDVAFLAAFAPGAGAAGAGEGPRVALVSPALDALEGRAPDPRGLLRLIGALHRRGRLDAVCVLAHDVRPQLDGAACAALAAQVNAELGIPATLANGDIGSRLLDSYRAASLVVTGRLHGLVAGALLGKPVLYTGDAAPKLAPFGDRLGFPCVRPEADDWPWALDQALERLDRLEAAAQGELLARMRREARRNFE
jgi:polysaccharide pyruvyl transferase WcaK-like protein